MSRTIITHFKVASTIAQSLSLAHIYRSRRSHHAKGDVLRGHFVGWQEAVNQTCVRFDSLVEKRMRADKSLAMCCAFSTCQGCQGWAGLVEGDDDEEFAAKRERARI